MWAQKEPWLTQCCTGRQGQSRNTKPRTWVPAFQRRTTEDPSQNGHQLSSMWATKMSDEPCQRSAHTPLPGQPGLTPALWLTSSWHSKSSPGPITATQLHPSYSQGTEMMERKCKHLLRFPLCGGKKQWARKCRWSHNWLSMSAKGSSNCLHWEKNLWWCMIISIDLLYQHKGTPFLHRIRY